jgi:NAD(P)-dependent dehydrogenase (short-subunit alcohol dehydrogenase family)
LLALTIDDWQQGFEQNFFSAVRLALACVPLMQERRWGRIVNIASTFGIEPDPYFGPYSAAKAALINFSKNLAQAFSVYGVLTNCVVPGVTRTEGVEANAVAAAERLGVGADEVMAGLMAKKPVPVGRFGDPAEIAAAVVFLASEAASWITGACLAVDGGTLRGI